MELRAELSGVRDELTQLRRRVGLRGRTAGADDATIDAVVERVEALFLAFQRSDSSVPASSAALSDADISRIADEVMSKFSSVFELVGEAEETSGAAAPRGTAPKPPKESEPQPAPRSSPARSAPAASRTKRN